MVTKIDVQWSCPSCGSNFQRDQLCLHRLLPPGGQKRLLSGVPHRYLRRAGHFHRRRGLLPLLQLFADARDPRAIPPRDPITLQAHETGVGESGRVPNTVKPRFKRKIRQPDFVS